MVCHARFLYRMARSTRTASTLSMFKGSPFKRKVKSAEPIETALTADRD